MNKEKLQRLAKKQLEDMRADFINFKQKKEEKRSKKFGAGRYGK